MKCRQVNDNDRIVSFRNSASWVFFPRAYIFVERVDQPIGIFLYALFASARQCPNSMEVDFSTTTHRLPPGPGGGDPLQVSAELSRVKSEEPRRENSNILLVLYYRLATVLRVVENTVSKVLSFAITMIPAEGYFCSGPNQPYRGLIVVESQDALNTRTHTLQ